MGKPKAPAPPDYAAAAREQGTANTNSAIATNFLNQADQVNPYGTLRYDYNYEGGQTLPDGTRIPKTTVTTALSPEQQRLLDQTNEMSGQLNDLAIKGIGYVGDASSTPINQALLPELKAGVGTPNFQRDIAPTSLGISGAPDGQQLDLNIPGATNKLVNSSALVRKPLQGMVGGTDFQNRYAYDSAGKMPSADDFAGQRDQITNALMERLQPQIDRDRESLRTQMANQGLGIGSEARDWEQRRQERDINDQRIAALLAGSSEQQRLFDDAMGIRQQGITEATNQGNLYNNASANTFNQALARTQFGNQTQQQGFDQSLQAGNFQNAAQAQEYAQAIAAWQARNAAIEGNNAQAMQEAQFGNQAQAQQFGQNQARMDAGNQAAEAAFRSGLAGGQFTNQARQQAIQEADYFKNQPLNMLNALRSGNQTTMPNFGNVMAGSTIAAPPVYQGVRDQYDAELQKYQQQMAGFQALLGGLGGIGGAAIGKWG